MKLFGYFSRILGSSSPYLFAKIDLLVWNTIVKKNFQACKNFRPRSAELSLQKVFEDVVASYQGDLDARAISGAAGEHIYAKFQNSVSTEAALGNTLRELGAGGVLYWLLVFDLTQNYSASKSQHSWINKKSEVCLIVMYWLEGSAMQ